MNYKTRPICHSRMGNGNNRHSHVIAHLLAESFLGPLKSKANPDVTTRLNCRWHCYSYSFNAQNMATPVWASCGYQFWHQLGEFKWRRSAMRIVVVMLVFIVYCDVCNTTCWCIIIIIIIIINNSYKRYSLIRVKLTALYKHLITKTTLTFISANKTLIIVT